MSHSSTSSKSPAESSGWLAKVPFKNGLLMIGGLLCVVCLIGVYWSTPATVSDSESDDPSDDDVMLTGLQPLGAMGVSDSANSEDEKTPVNVSFPDKAPATLPELTRSEPGPLFGNVLPQVAPNPLPDSVRAASFERQLVLPGASERPAGTPRAVANQPVWLTGTIETAPSN